MYYGGDTAGDGSDNFTGHVLDNMSGEQVAVLEQRTDEDLYAKQVYCLGMYYNTALIALETNFSTYPTRELERLRYPKLYYREEEDSITHRRQKKFGFRTTTVTRPIIIALLTQVVRENVEKINDIATLQEMLTFVKNEQGRAEAEAGKHDDHVIGVAIAHYIRPQQSMSVKVEISSTKAFNFEFEKTKPNALGAGERIKII